MRLINLTKRVARIAIYSLQPALLSLTDKEAPSIAIDPLGDWREYVFLLTALATTGLVGLRLRDIEKSSRMMQHALHRKSVRILNSRCASILGENKYRSSVSINTNYYSSIDDASSFRLPYFAHPEFYQAGHFEKVRNLRAGVRNKKIFFAGTINERAYSRNFEFPIMNRSDIFEIIYDQFAEYIGPYFNNDQSPISIVSTDNYENVLDKHQLEFPAYIVAISRSNFFMCPPGWLIPHSHNMIEAMSVGAIPITNYAHYIYPPLENGVNCLSFSDESTLKAAIIRALEMSNEEVGKMREAVFDYYDRNLDPVTVGTLLRQRIGDLQSITLNDESGR